MTMHAFHPGPSERDEFLVDGCPRCAEYVENLGLHFDADRFRAFWRKMVEVEFEDLGGYASRADKALGTKLYYVALAFQRAFGIDPALLVSDGAVRMLLDGLEVESITDLSRLVSVARAARRLQEALHRDYLDLRAKESSERYGELLLALGWGADDAERADRKFSEGKR